MTSPRVIYFGIRTQKSAAEVGGWSKVNQMGLKYALIYDTATGEYHNYTKSQVTNLINSLQNADLVVGFNQLNFDYKVLSTYTDTDLEALPNFDILNEIEQTLNFRVSRANLAQNTLNELENSKGRSTKNSVEITKKLFAHACKEGYLFYHNTRLGTKAMCDTSNWADTARNMTQRTRPLAKTMAPGENDEIKTNPPSITPLDIASPEVKPHKITTKVDNNTEKVSSNTQHKSDQYRHTSTEYVFDAITGCYQYRDLSEVKSKREPTSEVNSKTQYKPQHQHIRAKQIYGQTTKFQDAKPASTIAVKKEIEIYTHPIVHHRLSRKEYLFAKYVGKRIPTKYLGDQIPEEALQIYSDAKNQQHHHPALYTYKKVVPLLDPSISFQQFNVGIVGLWLARNPHERYYKNGNSRYYYIDGSGTIASERVNDYVDIRNIKEELARGI